jgi:hypothetical protein
MVQKLRPPDSDDPSLITSGHPPIRSFLTTPAKEEVPAGTHPFTGCGTFAPVLAVDLVGDHDTDQDRGIRTVLVCLFVLDLLLDRVGAASPTLCVGSAARHNHELRFDTAKD